MLENMFIGRPPGNYDRILDFSTAVTGNLFFVPTATFLDSVSSDQLAPAASPGAQNLAKASTSVQTSASPAPSKGGSLGIGSLKGENSYE
jgi:putative iron-dependent peroxidase